MKKFVVVVFSLLFFTSVFAQSANQPINDLDQLLAKVRAEHDKERELNRQREAEFLKERN